MADDISHECVDIAVDGGISGQYVTRMLGHAALFRGYMQAVRLILIEPGRPMQNGYIECFNGKFGDE